MKENYLIIILIIEMLNTHLFSMQHISEKLNIGNNTIGKINNGRYTKYQYPSHITKFPIHNYQKCKIVNSRVCTVDLYCNILLEYLKTNCTIKNYQKYQNKISQSLYNQIIRGEMPQYIQSFLQHPLEKHIPENIQILSDILNVYNKYK